MARDFMDINYRIIHYEEGEKIVKERRITLAQILSRPEQAAFRKELLRRYRYCVVTGCNVPEALEAAHIIPVAEEGADNVSNELLLRADLHLLFDAGLMWFTLNSDGTEVKVHFDENAQGENNYENFCGRIINIDCEDTISALRRRNNRSHY